MKLPIDHALLRQPYLRFQKAWVMVDTRNFQAPEDQLGTDEEIEDAVRECYDDRQVWAAFRDDYHRFAGQHGETWTERAVTGMYVALQLNLSTILGMCIEHDVLTETELEMFTDMVDNDRHPVEPDLSF